MVWKILAELILIISGIFLVLDSLFWHLITFNYAALGLGWLDPWFHHSYLGGIFILIGLGGIYLEMR